MWFGTVGCCCGVRFAIATGISRVKGECSPLQQLCYASEAPGLTQRLQVVAVELDGSSNLQSTHECGMQSFHKDTTDSSSNCKLPVGGRLPEFTHFFT